MKKTNKIIAIVLSLVFIASYFIVSSVSNRVLAVGTISIQFNNATISDGEASFTVDGENYKVAIGTKLSDGGFSKYSDGVTFSGNIATIDTATINMADTYISVREGMDTNVKPIIDGSEKSFAQGFVSISNLTTDHTGPYIFDLIANQNQGGGDDVPPGPVGGQEDITLNVHFTNTHMIGFINNIMFMDDRDGLVDSFEGVVNGAGTTNSAETNQFRFKESFGDRPVSKFVINNVEYEAGNSNVVVDDDGSFIITVPGAEIYTITGEANADAETMKTIIWTNPDYVPQSEEDAQWVEDFSIGHGYARAIEVYDRNNNKLSPDEYINTVPQPDGSRSDEYGLRNGFGWVKIMPGSRVVFEFIPEYGYQLTSISINEQEVEATADMNKFEFTMPDGSGNIHFSATFSETEDVLKTNSTAVSDGSIDLGNELDGGTAQLTVSDVELPADKIKGFSDAAGDYSVKTYLDIDLFQVFYKGKEDDSDVWSNKIDELDKEATVSIKLADGITADDIVIVHNVHDGEEYEVIKIESYNAATNTITFKTKSFSNYAIATKGEKTSKSKLPKAGDSIVGIVAAIVTAIAGLFIAMKTRK